MRTILGILLLGVVALVAAPDTNITGTWTGSFKMTNSEGQTKDGTALLLLKQTGAEITGTVGPDEGEQHAITKGRIEGDKISLESTDGGVTIKFELALAGDRITGDVNAAGEGRTMKAKLDVTRTK
jgi:hypothetical protein